MVVLTVKPKQNTCQKQGRPKTGIKDSDKLFRSNAGQAKGNPTANHKSHDKEGFSVKEF